jgi:hypothetical protein
LADELVDGAKGAALPLIRHDLGLSYTQIGLLASVPLLAGGLLELPPGLLAGHGRRRRLAALRPWLPGTIIEPFRRSILEAGTAVPDAVPPPRRLHYQRST